MFAMKKTGLRSFAALLAGLMVLMSAALPVTADVKIPTLMVDGQLMSPASPLCWDNESILISLEELAAYLNASFQWNEAEGTTWIQKNGRTIFFRPSTGEVRKNGELVSVPVSPRLINGTFYVPLRFVAENLGVTVVWDNSAYQVQIITGERHTPPERISDESFNAVVAYIDKGNLWLLDGRKRDVLPKQLTESGYAELIGWSIDGEWFAYKYASSESAPPYLWVVRADGKTASQVDTEPIYGDPLWSPKDNQIAYTVMKDSADGYIPASIVRYADITVEGIKVNTLLEEDFIAIPSLAWHPSGESITISFPRTVEQPPTLVQANLTGEQTVLYTLKDEAPVDLEGIYSWAFISLKWSPDGRYLAYHLGVNSASLTADGVETGVLNVKTGQSFNLSGGLNYLQWLAFSPDNTKLAYIAGGGRDAMLNKRLEIVDLISGKITDYSQKGYADTQPIWLSNKTNELLFCRGPETETLYQSEILPGTLAPGQRIYKLDNDGNAVPVTAGPADTADYFPNPSPSGEEIIFLRLERYDQGSLYLQPINAPEEAVEILRGLRGGPGYYGNYYPEWISVHWFE